MPTQGVDYSFSRPNITELWNQGYRFVMRYLSWLPNGKVISAAELKQLLDKGFSVGLNWEYSARDALRGSAGGRADATEAVKQAKSLQYPRGATIYFSSGDFDVTGEGKLTPVIEYVKSAAAITRSAGYRFGVYGGYHFLNELWNRKLIDDGWQSPSSFGHPGMIWDLRNGIHQKRLGVTLAGGQVDINALSGKPVYLYKKAPVVTAPVDPFDVVPLADVSDFSYPYEVILQIEKLAPVDLPATSTVRTLGSPGSPTWDYHVGKAAVDFGSGDPSRLTKAEEQGLGEWWISHAPYLTELIHSTRYADDNGYYVKNGKVVPPYAAADHFDHYHVAIAQLSTAVALLNKLLKQSKTHVYIKGVGVATLNDVAKAVWDYKLQDPARSTATQQVKDSAGNLLRYARIDSFRPSGTWLTAVVNAIKAVLPQNPPDTP